MNHDELHEWSKRAADWAYDYHTKLRSRPVRARAKQGETSARLLPPRPRNLSHRTQSSQTSWKSFQTR